MFPSFPRYKEGTGGRGQIEPGPPVIERNLMRTSVLLLSVPSLPDYVIKSSILASSRQLNPLSIPCVGTDSSSMLLLTLQSLDEWQSLPNFAQTKSDNDCFGFAKKSSWWLVSFDLWLHVFLVFSSNLCRDLSVLFAMEI